VRARKARAAVRKQESMAGSWISNLGIRISNLKVELRSRIVRAPLAPVKSEIRNPKFFQLAFTFTLSDEHLGITGVSEEARAPGEVGRFHRQLRSSIQRARPSPFGHTLPRKMALPSLFSL